jgi:hypothetical protein
MNHPFNRPRCTEALGFDRFQPRLLKFLRRWTVIPAGVDTRCWVGQGNPTDGIGLSQGDFPDCPENEELIRLTSITIEPLIYPKAKSSGYSQVQEYQCAKEHRKNDSLSPDKKVKAIHIMQNIYGI